MTYRLVPAVAIALFAVSAASAGEVYGKILEGSAPAAGAAVSAKCGAKAYPEVKTDKSGSYHLALAESGKCTLTVSNKGQTATLEVVSYDDPAQVDVILETKDGKLVAKRK
jgi:hypothetical protein